MGYSNGAYTRNHNFSADASANVKILATRHDQEWDDLASAMTNVVWTRDGNTTPTADIPMAGRRHVNVGAPTSVSNYMRVREFIENIPIFMQDVESSADRVSVSAQYFTSVSANQAPGDGTRILVRANSTKASAVLYLNGHSANVEYQDGNAANGVMVSGGVYEFIYSSVDTAWKVQNPSDGRHPNEITNGITPTNYNFPYLDIRRYGGVGDGVTNCTTALRNAITASRTDPETRVDTIGGSNITMYRSGVITFPKGTFVLSYDTLQLTQEMGITLRGQGSRRFTNAIKGATTLLFTGTSTGYGFYLYRNGVRSFQCEDLDICYDSNTFTGNLIDAIDCPGLTLKRCYVGTGGITAATRFQTSNSLIRATYDEFFSFEDCAFDGAVDGFWSDDSRSELSNTFGGFGLLFKNCAFYDFTGDMIRHDGNRTRSTVNIIDCHFNPISVDCTRCVDLNNIDGLNLEGSTFAPSTSFKAGTEWMRLVNVTGSVRANSFGDLTEAGTIGGTAGTTLELTGNTIFCTDGFTLTGGSIVAHANEFGQAVDGYIVAPTDDICVDLGPDVFKAGVTGNSYDIPADSALLAGRINYNRATDASTSKFTNASDRISILNIDRKRFSDASATLTLSILDTGRTVVASHSSGQVYTLPTPVPGCELSVAKASNQTLQVTAGSAILYAGVGAVKTSISAAAASDIGGMVSFKAFGTTAWQLTDRVGDWTLA